MLFQALGPRFVSRGWVFFAPWRRGQGLSETAGPYIMDDINAAWLTVGISAAAAVLVHRHETDQLDDQLAGLAWLRTAKFVAPGRIAVAGHSFGGIQTVLGVERADYCAGIDMAGAAMSLEAQSPATGRHDPRCPQRAGADLLLPGRERP